MRTSLKRYALLSLLAALTTIGLKGGAYAVTGSVGLLADALESLTNLLAALAVLVTLAVAERPPDDEHAYGHGKAEYFASGFEGALVLIAAVLIVFTAGQRLLQPQELADVGVGLTITVVASAVNFAVARVLLDAGKRYRSITLEADARHLMTDVWTSAGVVVGVGAAAWTGWLWLDPLVAIAVGLNILRIGFDLIRRSLLGLLDTSLPPGELQIIHRVLSGYAEQGVRFHALRTRQAGAWRFVSFHILVPGEWSVQKGHDLLEEIEDAVRRSVPDCSVFTHLEPLEDPISWEDTHLYRPLPP
jgi:cation diffusion facilitator family transporter